MLASISLGYPVGTVMMLRTGGDVRFKQRPVEGAAAASATLKPKTEASILKQAGLRGERR